MAAPKGLGARGRRLWNETTKDSRLAPAYLVLLEEACRISDRLDVLDGLIRGFSRQSGEDEGGSVNVAGLLSEARQQATALRGLVAEIRQAQKGSAAPGGAPAARAGGSGVSDLTARIAARRGQSSG